MSVDMYTEHELERLREELAEAKQQINSLRISVRAEELRVKISSEYSNFGLWEYDIAEDICYQYKKLNGRYQDNLEPIIRFRDSVISWGSVYSEDLPEFNRFCDSMERGDKEVKCDVRVINDDCDLVWFRYEGKTVYDDDGKPLRVIGRTIDVTEEKGGIHYNTDSHHDPVTGAYNLETFKTLVAERTTGAYRYKNSAILSIKLDGFEEWSETSDGGLVKDVLRSVGKILLNMSACEHDSCVASAKDGEFVFFLRFVDIHSLNAFAAKIVFTIANFPFGAGRPLTVSEGVAFLKNGKSFDNVYSEAYTAMCAAEKKGGNGYLHYSNSMNVETLINMSEIDDGIQDGVVTAGMGRIYSLVNRAYYDKKNRAGIIARALVEMAKYVGASTLCVYWYRDGKFSERVCYNDSDRSIEESPKTVTVLSDRTVLELLSAKYAVTLNNDVGVGEDCGIALENGAVVAECRAIKQNDKVVGYFALAFDSMVTMQVADGKVLDIIQSALDDLFTLYAEEQREATRLNFANAVINNLQIEGYSIIPDTYEVEYVGENAVARYDLQRGDVCYRKIRGLDAPCKDCPAKRLSGGELIASTAYYDESEHKWLNITASAESNIAGEQRYFISMTDITSCLGQIKTSDYLTGVMTFDVFTAEAIRMTAGDPQGYFMAVVNIARFRQLNEDLGYEYGDSLLIAVADILERYIGAGELICRSEGSRFVVLFKNSCYADLVRRLNILMASIQKQVYEKTETEIFLLWGIYEMGEDSVGIMGALDRAIIAQKTIKDKTYYKDNLIAVYDDQMKNVVNTRKEVEAHMLEALDNDEFKVYYQPKVSISTGKVTGMEALVRWIRPDGQVISPAKFVPVFEANGFIADMDFAVYRHAIADMKSWLRKGIDVPLVSLNVSRHHVKDENFVAKLCSLVDALGVPHEKIELEITESMLAENLNKLVEIMTQLKAEGFRISVDDFGSGYSSLNLITLLPFDTLKIDGGFFLNNELTEKNKAVISTIVTLAKSLNLETVCEGIERQEQVDFLREQGCDIVQGYYYYKPMPVENFQKLIEKQ